MTNKQLSIEIYKFIVDMNLIDSNKISSDADIENDLGITGDDAWEFINDFSKKFNVDISEFEFSKYFKQEGGSLIEFLHNLFTGTKKNKRTSMTLGMLDEAIKKGRLE